MRSVELDVSSEWTSRYSSQRIVIVTPGRLSSRARAAQSGSARRRWPCVTPARPNSRASRASSVTSSASGQASAAAAARFRLSWIVERATPRRRPISRALTPSWWSRNRCRNCRMLSSRFAGIPNLLVDHRRARSAAVAEPRGANAESRDRLRWPASFRNGGRDQIGTVADIKSESPAGLRRNSHVVVKNAFSSRQSRSLPYHKTIQSLRTFARWYDLIFGRVGVLRRENSPSPLCIDRRWQGRRSAQMPQPNHIFDIVRSELSGLDSGDLTTTLGQRELRDYAILDVVRAPVSSCETKGHHIAFHF